MGPFPSDLNRRLSRLFLEPSGRLDDPARRSTATLFAGCLLALVLLFGAYDLYWMLVQDGYGPPWPGYLMMTLAYALVRAGYFYPSVLLTLGMLPTVAFTLVVTGHSPAPTMTLTLPVLGALLGTLLVDAWTTAALSLLAVALIATTALWPGPHRLPWQAISGPLLVNLLGGAIGVLSIVHRTRLEREGRRALESSAAELEQRVRARTIELDSTISELESFSYSVSHDLRAPLRAIEGFAAVLAEDHGDALGPGGRETLGVIRKSGARMSAMIDSLLDLSSVTRSPLVRDSLDLVTLASEVIRELRAAEPERDVHVVLPPTLPASGDAALLRTILQNLLGNAWKFTAGVQGPSIELAGVVRHGRRYFVVRDNGAGFDMAKAEHLFRPFERLHDAADFPGTGIGLATAARAVHRHGGDLFAEARVGAGAEFYFDLGQESACGDDHSRSILPLPARPPRR